MNVCKWHCGACAGRPIAQHLQDYRPLPDSFQRTVLSEEGSTYYFWWSAVYNLGIAASCLASNTARTVSHGMPQLSDPAHTWLIPPGWEVHSVVWSNANMDTAEPGLYLPLAAILHKEDALAVLIRGTETFNDWQTGEVTCVQSSTQRHHHLCRVCKRRIRRVLQSFFDERLRRKTTNPKLTAGVWRQASCSVWGQDNSKDSTSHNKTAPPGPF